MMKFYISSGYGACNYLVNGEDFGREDNRAIVRTYSELTHKADHQMTRNW